jgi:magnesium transporter
VKRDKRHRKIGMLPGTLIHTGKQKMDSVEMTVIHYDEEKQSKRNYKHKDSKSSEWSTDGVHWINIYGLHDVDQIKKIGETFNLHHLLLEDILSIGQRSKMELYEDCIFMSVKMFNLTSEGAINSEQISLVLKENTLISFQEKRGDVFNGIRKSIEENLGRVRKKKTDYLMYRLLDVIVDNYFLISDNFEEQIDNLEDNIDQNEMVNLDKTIRDLKKQVSVFRKDIRPALESLRQLADLDLVDESTRIYLSDVYGHLSQIIDELDINREALSSLTDQYHAYQGTKLNKVMKVLTIVSTIFIPLTFVVGIYGMNFTNIPELSWENGYFMTWGLMIFITIFMMALFRYKKWW